MFWALYSREMDEVNLVGSASPSAVRSCCPFILHVNPACDVAALEAQESMKGLLYNPKFNNDISVIFVET